MNSMFKFALNMYVADMKRSLRGFWWLAPIFLVLVLVAPFHNAQMYAFPYLIMMTIFLFIPNFSRIHFVVPLNVKQIKHFFIWRMALVCITMLLAAGLIIGISEISNIEWSTQGFHWLAFYMVIFLLCSEMGLRGLGIKNKFEVRHVIAIIVGIMSIFCAFGILENLPFVWEMVISFGLVLISVGYMFYYLKKIKFEDYTYVPRGLWENGKVERN